VEGSTLALLSSSASSPSVMCSAGLGDKGSAFLFVSATSAVQTVDDLRGGAVIAQQPAGASSTLMLRYALEFKHNIRSTGSSPDVTWIQIPEADMASRMYAGAVSAVMLNSYRGWEALTDSRLRLLYTGTKDFVDEAGGYPLNTGLMAPRDLVAIRGDQVREVNRLLAASARYAGDHQLEVFGDIAREENIPIEYLTWWWETFEIQWGPLRAEHARGISILWDAAMRLGDASAAQPPRMYDVTAIDSLA
jgi:hypothetical protein